jgi:hypothetical protein
MIIVNDDGFGVLTFISGFGSNFTGIEKNVYLVRSNGP